MEIELQEIRDFVAAHAPFDSLPAEALDALPRKLNIRYLRRGSRFPPQDADCACLYLLRSGAIDLRDGDGRLIEKLGEGDLYAHACRNRDEPSLSAVASEDCLLYLLPCAELDALCTHFTAFAQHFNESSQARLKQALSVLQATTGESSGALATRIGELIARPPVTIEAGSSIRAAARKMADEQVSSLMIVDADGLVGLVTDSDLRRRCLAEDLPTTGPIDDIMSGDIKTVSKQTPAFEALLLMTRHRLHHLPVRDGDTLAGMVSAADIMRLQSHNPVFLSSGIRKAQSLEELQQLSARLPELQIQMSRAGAGAANIGEAIASITDAITTRLTELAEQRLGSAPVPYVWLAGGSQGRREQSCHSDQDNALLIADSLSADDADYFAELSRYVCDALHACGFVHCPGEAMASNPRWRQPLATWREYFTDWIERPEPRALMLASIFFDLRPVCGDAALFTGLQQEVLERSRDNGIFIAHLVGNALSHRPPLGFFRHLVLIHEGEHKNTLDIKHRGLVPIVDIARIYALSGGIAAVNTGERLREACAQEALSGDTGASLLDAFELIGSLRVRHQAAQLLAGQPADNYLPPASLSRLERNHLKDAFAVIKQLQDTLEQRYQAGRFT